MAGNNKTKKKYIPSKRPSPLLAGLNARRETLEVNLNVPLTQDQLITLKTPPHASLQALATGVSNTRDWKTVLIRLLVGLKLAEHGYDASVVKAMQDAIMHCTEIQLRATPTKLKILQATPEEVVELAAALEAVDEMQDQADRATLHLGYSRAMTMLHELSPK